MVATVISHLVAAASTPWTRVGPWNIFDDKDLKGEAVDSVFSRQAFFDAVKEDQAALQAELDDDSPAAEPEPEPAPQLMSIDAAVKAVRDNEHPFNWLLMQVGEAAA